MGLRILGLDPGSRFTGYGLVEKEASRITLVEFGRIELGSSPALADRFADLHTRITGLMNRLQPQAVALEALFHGPNVRSLIVLAQARGALLAAIGLAGLPLREYSPSEIKSAVAGSGRADKDQVAKMVRLILGIRGPLAVDAADALAAAICFGSRLALERLTLSNPVKPPKNEVPPAT